MSSRSQFTNLALLGLCVAALGCRPVVAEDDPSGGSTSSNAPGSASGDVPDPSTSGTPMPPTTGVPPDPTGTPPGTSGSTTSGTWGSSSDDGGFIIDPDGGWCGAGLPDGVLAHCTWCDPKAQDCAKGETCKAWANNGSPMWNSTRCGPVDPEPGQRGEPCVSEGSAASGIDSCDIGLMCWNVDAETLEGTCVEYCDFFGGGGIRCSDVDERCSEFNNGVLPLCLPSCDPLASACADGFGCYPGSEDDFVCIREGDPVHLDVFHPECPAGTFWAAPDAIEGCVDDLPCCTAFCDITVPDSCGPDAECLSYFEGDLPKVNPLGFCSVAN
ncbi:MAG: hypothetical protein ACRBN8_40500 [Nannocystales bacterium]